MDAVNENAESRQIAKVDDCDQIEVDSQSEENEYESEVWTTFDFVVLGLKIVIYLTMQAIAVMFEFGAVFFVLSLFYLIFTNLRNRKRKKGELSAYSVFNPGCEAIEGTLSAEKLQSELTFGALHY
ncbi:hypothetical protein B4U79_15789 [Dinothrombium tinctorium]|uniref:SAYSvFN domain-containing protein n=1 Tax=Dinothrombium tinctorium TaxID=1965070 RepID=A0A3S3PVH3_9ACAR|nr:hypothetical protein B4U79_15789 [Dinothrombium tinctorium]